MTAVQRQSRTVTADQLVAKSYDSCDGPAVGVAVVAVGGFGRGELAPHSDLDVVLVHADDVEPGDLATALWYPIWDSGWRLDHSVRSFSEMVDAAADLKVALGLLDVRHLAGDRGLTLRLRTTMLADWRRQARVRLPELRALSSKRHQTMGELAHASVPDLKEAEGGLRDASVLKALEASWLVDASTPALEAARQGLLDVRDLLHELTDRASDRITPELWTPLARSLELDDAEAAQRHVRAIGRRISHLSRLAWQRTESVIARPSNVRDRRTPALTTLAPGIALSRGEVVLDRGTEPGSDPTLLLRAAAEAATRGVVLSPVTASRLVRDGSLLPTPWPAPARDALVRLLASGPGLLPVWETLEETGAVERFLPEWEDVRLLPHASTIHRFTVDRHMVETCVEAAGLIRTVARPDVLVVAALLHDIGKAELIEHSVAGEPIARAIAQRMGFDEDAVHLIATLVRRHLLLPEIATSRDPDDPATIEAVLASVSTPETLDLLRALTEADARATSPQAWTSWRARLVGRLVDHAKSAMSGATPERARDADLDLGSGPLPRVRVEPTESGSRVSVMAVDQVGLLADVAAMFGLQRVSIRAARAWSQDDLAASVWDVAEPHLDERVLRERLDAIIAGRLDTSRLARPAGNQLPSAVTVRADASRHATVLEVRTGDRPGVVHLVCKALAALDISVCSAHIETYGPQSLDVFHVQEASAGQLADGRSAEAARCVAAALEDSG